MSIASPSARATRRDRASAGRAGLKVVLVIAALSALAVAVLFLWPGGRGPSLARFLPDDRPAYPGNAREIWDSRLQTELNYWKDQIRRQDSKAWHAEYASRLDPDAPLQDVIARHLDRTVEVNRILDVGSGPLTSINRKCDSCKVSITAVDPLADFFNELLARHGITPPVPAVEGWGERLTERFGENQFEIAYSRNAVDHSYDPIKCIDEMIKVTKRNGYVIVEMNERAGSIEEWRGLHQWDFFVERTLPLLRKHLFLEGRSIATVDVTRHFDAVAETTMLEVTPGPVPWITLVLRKRAD
jgi:SAM-dependent methyltransferase